MGEEMRSDLKTPLSILILLGTIPFIVLAVHGEPVVSRSDGGIVPNPEWMGIPTIQEDSVPFAISLDGISGPFINGTDNIDYPDIHPLP